MIRVFCGTNSNMNPVELVDPNTTTPRMMFEQANIDYARGTVSIDGSNLKVGEIDKTFAELGVTDTCFLVSVVKADNA